MGRLEIRVCGARNIGDVQKVGKPDPYVKVYMGESKHSQIKFKTRVIENSFSPTWNELFKFQVADYDSSQILFEVWNDNVLKDDLLGSYTLSLNGLQRGVVKDMWVILSKTKLSCAELHLHVLAVDFGQDPPAGTATTSSLEADNMSTPSQASRPSRPSPHPLPQVAYTSAPQGPPQAVSYGYPQSAPQAPSYQPPNPVYQPTYAPPVQPVYAPQPQPAYYAPPPQPMYAAPPPQPMYQPQTSQMAYGLPPGL